MRLQGLAAPGGFCGAALPGALGGLPAGKLTGAATTAGANMAPGGGTTGFGASAPPALAMTDERSPVGVAGFLGAEPVDTSMN